VSCIIAESFARIFFRNAINIGLPILESPEAAQAAQQGDKLTIDLTNGQITNERTGQVYKASPYPPFVLAIINAGGLVPYTRNLLGIQISSN
jgi:3-isopropylmalate/(R)-2-methylmalate dehydratase small subunit